MVKIYDLPGPNRESWLIPAPPQFRPNCGTPLLQGEDKVCFGLVKPGGGRGSWELLRLVRHSLFCPMGSGGQLGLYSEYFAENKIGRRKYARENDFRKTDNKKHWR